jgi:16S rRNA (uracil1498-N3)-methyltransferase
VWRITPILCDYGVAKPDQEKASWHAELVVAMKQSGNAFLPRLDAPLPFAEALAGAMEPGVFGAVPRAGASSASSLPSAGDLGLWIGPEGGFSTTEEDGLYARDFAPLTVGRWILRVETAVPALLGCLSLRAAERLETP